MGYKYAKYNQKKIRTEIYKWMTNRYKKLGHNYSFKTKNIPLEYCNALMGKIINNDLKKHVEIISHGNARAYRWKTKLGEN
jgi:hypothetical protein